MKTLLSTAAALALLTAAQAAPVIELSVKPERDLLLRGGPRETIVQIALIAKDAGEKRKMPLNLALVLDRSGSMAGAKLEKARQAACVAVDQMAADDIFSLVAYDEDAEVLIPPRKVEDREALKREINRIKDGGSTALYAGVEKGAAQLRKYLDKEKVNRIILLSDGLANVGPSSPGDLAKLGKELRKEGLGVSTVGLGDDYNEDLMTALAEASRANYYYVQDAEKLPGIFREELGSVKNVVARNVNVIITLPDGVKSARLLGDEEYTFENGTVTIPLSEFQGAQTRKFLLSCEAPAGDQAELKLARVELSYNDTADGQPRRENQWARVRQTEDRTAFEQSVQSEVASQVAITRNRLAKETAVRLADEGKAQQAAELLLQQRVANAALPAAAQSQQLKDEDALLRNKAEELQRDNGWSKASRKSTQYENYQDKKSGRGSR